MGGAWIVCRPCCRFVAVGRWLNERDSRVTTFSCSVCGGDGKLVFEDPEREGLQHDPRPRPLRHPLAAMRLRTMHKLADPFGHKAARETLPQRDKPHHHPPTRYRLAPLPIRTFREAFGFGLGLRIHCPGCHDWRPVELTAESLDIPFAGGVRFTCRRVKRKLYGEGTAVCGCIGEPYFQPVTPPGRDRPVVDIQCGGGRRHPRWEISGIDLAAPPWSGLLDAGVERFRCPGCRAMPRHTFHAPYPHDRRAPDIPTFS